MARATSAHVPPARLPERSMPAWPRATLRATSARTPPGDLTFTTPYREDV